MKKLSFMRQRKALTTAILAALVAALVLGLAFVGCATNGGGTTSGPAYADTLTWTEVQPFGVPNNPDDDNIFMTVAYGGGKFFATRNNDNRLVSSTDGVTWTEVTPSPITGGRGVVAYGAGKWVAARGNISYSADGVTWTRVANNPFGDFTVNGIAYGGGKFVAVGGGGMSAYSADGVTWTTNRIWERGSNYLASIAYGGGKFVVGHGRWGALQSSQDGVTWSEDWYEPESSVFTDDTVAINSIAYGAGAFIAVAADSKMGYSTDGVTWTAVRQSVFGEGDTISAVAYGAGRFVIVGYRGRMSSANTAMAYSTDGITWTELKLEDSPKSNRGVLDIAYGNGRFVIALGEDKIAYSNLQE